MPHYSPTTQSFYCQDIHEQSIPPDAVIITDDEHMALIDGVNNQGKRITIDATGRPALIEAPPLPIDEQQKDLNRRARTYLDATDWMVIRQQETGVPVPPHILKCRMAARRSVVDTTPTYPTLTERDFSLEKAASRETL